MFVFTLCSGLTMEVSGNSDLPLQSVDFRVNGDPRVVSHPKCLYHSLLQSLGHILFCYMFNTQVWKAGKKTQPNKKTNILDSIKYVLFMFCLVFLCMHVHIPDSGVFRLHVSDADPFVTLFPHQTVGVKLRVGSQCRHKLDYHPGRTLVVTDLENTYRR